MIHAASFALRLRLRQYVELAAACFLRPKSAAMEISSYPACWAPGAVVVVCLSCILPWSRAFPLRGGSPNNAVFEACMLAAAAGVCAASSRRVRWSELFVLWGYCWLPYLPGSGAALLTATGVDFLCRRLALGPQSQIHLFTGAMGVVVCCTYLAMLRLGVASVRSVTGRGTPAATALLLAAILGANGLVEAVKALS